MAETRNTLSDMYNIFAEQLERLNDVELKGEALEDEIKRADAMAKISGPILEVANITYRAWSKGLEYGIEKEHEHVPRMLEAKE